MRIPDLPEPFITDAELKTARITREVFFSHVAWYYCPVVSKNSSCGRIVTNSCDGCQATLRDVLAIKEQRQVVRNPEAMSIHRLRSAAARLGEHKATLSKSPQIHRDSLGLEIPRTSAFDSLAKKLGVG